MHIIFNKKLKHTYIIGEKIPLTINGMRTEYYSTVFFLNIIVKLMESTCPC